MKLKQKVDDIDLSHDAGLFLCEYIYHSSLVYFHHLQQYYQHRDNHPDNHRDRRQSERQEDTSTRGGGGGGDIEGGSIDPIENGTQTAASLPDEPTDQEEDGDHMNNDDDDKKEDGTESAGRKGKDSGNETRGDREKTMIMTKVVFLHLPAESSPSDLYIAKDVVVGLVKALIHSSL